VVKIRQAAGWYSRPIKYLVGCTSQQPDGFLPPRAFKPSSSESGLIHPTTNPYDLRMYEDTKGII
jgi:hypothetical protein